jgi:hypothetical protein
MELTRHRVACRARLPSEAQPGTVAARRFGRSPVSAGHDFPAHARAQVFRAGNRNPAGGERSGGTARSAREAYDLLKAFGYWHDQPLSQQKGESALINIAELRYLMAAP